MFRTSGTNWWYLIICATLVLGVAVVGNHYTGLATGPRYWIQNLSYNEFTIDINGTDMDSPFSNLPTVSDTLRFDITVHNPDSTPVNFRYIPMINYTQKNVYNGTMMEKRIQPNGNVQFTYLLPLEHEGINNVIHGFSYYTDSERGPKTYQLTSRDIRVYTQVEQNTILQQTVVLQYAWIPAIPLILTSMKLFREFWDHK